MKNKVKLSLCMIVKDEERNLPGCLQSAQGLVDEIVVVDTGSKDRTPEIARDFGAKVYPFKWTNDFAAARNESLRHATGDYALWLDADDRVPEAERDKFLAWKEGLSLHDKKAYQFVLQSPKEEGDFLTEFCYQLRAFPLLPGVRFIRRIHESVIESLNALKVPVLNYDLTILHIGYSKKEDMERKAKRNLQLLLATMAEDPKDYAVYWHLSMTYNLLGDKRKSAHYVKRLLEEGDWERQREWYIAAMVHLANLYRDLEQVEEAESLLQEALRLDPKNRLPLFFLAALYVRQGKYPEALPILERLKTLDIGVSPVPFSAKAAKFYTHLWLGNCYEAQGDRERAFEEYALAAEINPDWVEREIELGEFYLRQGEDDKALLFLKRALRGTPSNPALLSNLAILYKRKGDLQEAESLFKRALSIDPDHLNTLANLGHLLLREERYEEAEGYLRRALQLSEAHDLRLALSYLYITQGRIEEALPHCERVMRSLGLPSPGTLDSFGDLALLYLRIGDELKRRAKRQEAILALKTAQLLLQQEALVASGAR